MKQLASMARNLVIDINPPNNQAMAEVVITTAETVWSTFGDRQTRFETLRFFTNEKGLRSIRAYIPIVDKRDTITKQLAANEAALKNARKSNGNN